MTDISQRIMDAWLAVNPEPEWNDPSINEWHRKLEALQLQLHAKAYESAVIQFLMPDGWVLLCFGGGYAHMGKADPNSQTNVEGRGATVAEALLNAALAARENAPAPSGEPLVFGVTFESRGAGLC